MILAGKWHQIFFNFQNMYEAIRSVTCVVSLSLSSPWSWHAMIMITCHWCWVSKRWQHTTLYLLTNWLSSSYTCQALHDDYTSSYDSRKYSENTGCHNINSNNTVQMTCGGRLRNPLNPQFKSLKSSSISPICVLLNWLWWQ